MPRLPLNYQETIIYKIVCNDLNVKDVYVGHTTNFIKRKYQHKLNCNNEKGKSHMCNLKVYQMIRTHGGWNNWTMVEIEKYPCNDLNEATKQERYWYEQLNSSLNTQYPARTIEEQRQQYNKRKKKRYEENKEQMIEYRKQYQEQHKEEMVEYRKQYREKNLEKIKEHKRLFYEQNKEEIKKKMRERSNSFKEQMKQYNKQYYEQHKEEIKNKKKNKLNKIIKQ
jgi:hypothetical protein